MKTPTWSIERSVAWILLPLARNEFVECLGQHLMDEENQNQRALVACNNDADETVGSD